VQHVVILSQASTFIGPSVSESEAEKSSKKSFAKRVLRRPPNVEAESADIAPESSFVPEYSRGQLWRER
jgi:hypothetical protein